MDIVKPVRRSSATHGNYSHDSFRQERRESAVDEARIHWTIAAKNRLIDKLKAILWPGWMGRKNAEAQFPKPKFQEPKTATPNQPRVTGAKGSKKQVPPQVRKIADAYMRKSD